MPTTSTTRRGNGAGWGGPAKGEGKPVSEWAGRPAGVKDGAGKRSVADLMAELGARELAARRWLEILNDPAHPKHADMVAKAADRLDGAPKVTAEVTQHGYVITAPAEAEDADAWARQHQPKP